MIIDVNTKKDHLFWGIKYIGLYKDIIIFSDGTLSKNSKQMFWKKINSINKQLQAVRLDKKIPNAFFYIGESKISYDGKNQVLFEIIFKNSIIRQFYISDFNIYKNEIYIGCSSLYASKILVEVLLGLKVDVVLTEKFKVLIKNRNDLKIKFTV